MVESRLILVSKPQGTGSLGKYNSNFPPLVEILCRPLRGLLYVYWAVPDVTIFPILSAVEKEFIVYCSVRSYSLELTRRPVVATFARDLSS